MGVDLLAHIGAVRGTGGGKDLVGGKVSHDVEPVAGVEDVEALGVGAVGGPELHIGAREAAGTRHVEHAPAPEGRPDYRVHTALTGPEHVLSGALGHKREALGGSPVGTVDLDVCSVGCASTGNIKA